MMAELGSIYEADTRSGARGRDLHAQVVYPVAALGSSEGVWIDVPLDLMVDGELVRRTPSPFDRDSQVLLRLPAGFPEGGALRLRGQGETPASGGPAGDLFVQIEFGGELPAMRGLVKNAATIWPALPNAPSPSMIVVITLGGAALLYWVAATL
ncbi:MAG TPA: hypothetical protein ENK31_01220 [Nannocystis exedens]|nr:hypothetical protein [Nannocystis exedens]